MSYTVETFLAKIKPMVILDMNTNNILASLTAAQALLESNKGNSGLTTKANNLFGIKGSYNGQSVKMLTTEFINGKATKVYADFRKYPSWAESINDHSQFLRKYKRYASIIGERNYIQACQKMGASGYATSPSYGASLLNICNIYKLYEWDGIITSGSIASSSSYVIGKTYKLQANMYVRDYARGNKIPFESLTENAKQNGFRDDLGYAILKLGTKVTCKSYEVMGDGSEWIKIPSGWICGKTKNNTYVS